MSLPKTLAVNRNVPSTPSIITGTTYGLCGATNKIYSVTNVAGVTYQLKFETAGGNVKVSALNGCGYYGSKSLVVAITCREEFSDLDDAFDVSVYSNPGRNYFMLSINSSAQSDYSLTVHDVLGRIVEQYVNVEDKHFVFGTALKDGLYLVEVFNGKEKKLLRVVKENF